MIEHWVFFRMQQIRQHEHTKLEYRHCKKCGACPLTTAPEDLGGRARGSSVKRQQKRDWGKGSRGEIWGILTDEEGAGERPPLGAGDDGEGEPVRGDEGVQQRHRRDAPDRRRLLRRPLEPAQSEPASSAAAAASTSAAVHGLIPPRVAGGGGVWERDLGGEAVEERREKASEWESTKRAEVGPTSPRLMAN